MVLKKFADNNSVPHLSSIGGDLLYLQANELKDIKEFGYINFI